MEPRGAIGVKVVRLHILFSEIITKRYSIIITIKYITIQFNQPLHGGVRQKFNIPFYLQKSEILIYKNFEKKNIIRKGGPKGRNVKNRRKKIIPSKICFNIQFNLFLANPTYYTLYTHYQHWGALNILSSWQICLWIIVIVIFTVKVWKKNEIRAEDWKYFLICNFFRAIHVVHYSSHYTMYIVYHTLHI